MATFDREMAKSSAFMARYGGRAAQVFILNDLDSPLMNNKEGLYNPVVYDKADVYQRIANIVSPTIKVEQPFVDVQPVAEPAIMQRLGKSILSGWIKRAKGFFK